MAYSGAVSGSGGYPSLAHQQHAQADRLKASINAGATAADIRADDVGSMEPYKAKMIAVLNGWKGM